VGRMRRHLGDASGISVSAVGAGYWAIGGPWQFDGRPAGWGTVDDDESIRGIHTALDLGITLFDTADVYGCGHSERVLGRALVMHRDEVVISTKFGLQFDEATRTGAGTDVSPEYVRRACEASLRRLGTDRIDLYQLHAGAEDRAAAAGVVEVLDTTPSRPGRHGSTRSARR
jgi:aryl-alcohol dehydrogenase-like predicted oxidoreductase